MATRKRTHGSGTITRRSNGRFTAQVSDGRTGRRRALGTFGTRRDAESASARASVDGTPGHGERTTLGDYLVAWLAGLDAYVKPSTATGHRAKVRAYVLPHPIAGVRLGRLRPGDFRAHFAMLAERGGVGGRALADSSVAGVDRVLTTALNAAVRDGAIRRSPMPDKRVSIQWRERPWADDEATGRLVRFVRFRDAEMELAVRLGAIYGLRRAEVAGLRWADVDTIVRTVRIHHTRTVAAGGAAPGDTKTRGSRRQVSINEATAEVFERHRACRAEVAEAMPLPTEYVYVSPLGEPWYPDTLTERFAAVVKAFNVTYPDAPLPHGFTFHSLRHSFASNLIAAGTHPLIVARAMGHDSTVMVDRTYGHLAPSTVAAAVDRLAAAIDG